MKHIYIIGAGGFAAECHQYLVEVKKHDIQISFEGFLAKENRLGQYNLSSFFLGDYEGFAFPSGAAVILGIGTPSIRKKLFEHFLKRNISFYTLIAPSALVSASSSIGEGCVICHNVFVGPAVTLGRGNLVNVGTTLGHDASIGDFNMINSHVDITGFARIGDLNLFGTHAAMLPHSKVGSRCKIAAGSVVYKRIRDDTLAAGNPAQKILDLATQEKRDGCIS